jgi:hypothetical protein
MEQDPPTGFGVFKPVGCTVISFPGAGQAAQARAALGPRGLAGEAIVSPPADAPSPVAESPDRQLDAATASGHEEERAELRPAADR